MNKKYWLLYLIASLLLFATACNSAAVSDVAEDEHMGEDEHSDHAHAHVAPPREFAGLGNPFAGDEAAIAAGKETYENLCATCHGPEGKGDGLAAAELDPKPASLADGSMMNGLSEGYLFWRVSKGGAMEPFNSAMPAWETSLSEDQRWQVISYVRTLATNVGEHMDDHEEHMDDHEEHMDEHEEHMDEQGEHVDDYEEHVDDHEEHEEHMDESEGHMDNHDEHMEDEHQDEGN